MDLNKTILDAGHANKINCTYEDIPPVLEKYETACLMLLGFGGISLVLAVSYNYIRRNVYHEEKNVDRTFDAGGKVSTSLTAVTVASQLLWPGDLMQSATVTYKTGIAGPFWYTVGAAMNIAVFPVMSAHLKTKAPGAKTYPQIIQARHGKLAHIIYSIQALLVNMVIIASLVVAGTATIKSVTKDASDEFCTLVIATLFGCYSFIGGLGTTFYVSYFNTVSIYVCLTIIIVNIFYNSDNGYSFDSVYNKLTNATLMNKIVDGNLTNTKIVAGIDGNLENSYFTFVSETGMIYALVGLVLTSSITYCDQASWQSRIAAKPMQGVTGFFLAALMWFAIPSSIAVTTGMTFLSTVDEQGCFPLSEEQVEQGLVTPYIAKKVLGDMGSYLILIMVGMALMSTGAAEVMAVSSIIVYDIYAAHIAPFRRDMMYGLCILCGRIKSDDESHGNSPVNSHGCQCPEALTCEHCKEKETDVVCEDDKYVVHRKYLCPFHGRFRVYQDRLFNYKNWCILWISLAIVPLGLVVIETGIDLNWAMLTGSVFTIPGLPGLVLTIFWAKSTWLSVILGSLTGLVGGFTTLIAMASREEGGLDSFVRNTAMPHPVLAGGCASLFGSLIVNVLVSLCTHNIKTEEDRLLEWKKLRAIDNPLHPWTEFYREDLPEMAADQKPTKKQLSSIFKPAKYVSYIFGGIFLGIFVFIIPAVMTSLKIFSFDDFHVWTMSLHVWCFIMAAIIAVLTPVEEILQIVAALNGVQYGTDV
ncbi:uncharacterized protein [Mytilus edulis]|uniref:uncharacterized protein n=1 Tax=Mytilus edulis TaxID=6550 RepID=UPI0039EF6E03